MQEMPVLFLRHGYAFEYKNNRPTSRAHVDRLIRRVQHQHGRMQRVSVAFLMHGDDCAHWHMRPERSTHRIIPLPDIVWRSPALLNRASSQPPSAQSGLAAMP